GRGVRRARGVRPGRPRGRPLGGRDAGGEPVTYPPAPFPQREGGGGVGPRGECSRDYIWTLQVTRARGFGLASLADTGRGASRGRLCASRRRAGRMSCGLNAAETTVPICCRLGHPRQPALPTAIRGAECG